LCLVAISKAAAQTCGTSPVEVFILQDGSYSFSKYLSQAQSQYIDVSNKLNNRLPDLKLGLMMFGDRDYMGATGECYREMTPLTSGVGDFQSSLSDLEMIFKGGTNIENSFDVALYAAGTYAGFTDANGDATRLLVIVTDGDGHIGVDDDCCTGAAPNSPGKSVTCDTNHSYVTGPQIKQVFSDTGVYVLVLVVPYGDYDASANWDWHLQNTAGLPADRFSVQSLTNGVAAIDERIADFACGINTGTTTAIVVESTTAEQGAATVAVTSALVGGGVIAAAAAAGVYYATGAATPEVTGEFEEEGREAGEAAREEEAMLVEADFAA